MVLNEKKHEHIPLLRAIAVGLEDDERQDDRFKECVDNGFVKRKDIEILKRHLYAETKRRSSGSLKALSSWNVRDLTEYLQNIHNSVKEKDKIWIVKTIDNVLQKFERSPPVWYVSPKNKAVGYTVLYNLMMKCEESHIFEKPVISDLKQKCGDINYRDCLMGMNWLKLYLTLPVMEGLRKKCDKNISKIVKEYVSRIQCLKNKKIRMLNFHPDEIHIISVDGIHFITEEFLPDPSRKWYDFKKNSPGLASVVFP